MDNISHTLIGALVGECLARFSRSDMPAQPRRDLVVVLAAVGSNLPDLDLLDSGWHDRLDYLLHHRGYTHTILIALATALLLAGVAQWWLRRRHLVPSRHDWAVLGAAAVLGPALHLAMDYSNSYGVHPLWPLDNRWVYGDAIFIVEPWLWLAATPLLFTLRSRLARLLLALALGLIVVAAFGSGLVRLPVAFALAAAAGTLLVIGARCRAAVALGCGLALWLGASACFIGAGALLRARLTAFADTTWPRERLADVVLTPLPAYPLCWEALLVQTQGDALIARRAMVALLPDRVPAARCPARGLRGATTAPLSAVAAVDDAQRQWFGQVRSSLGALRAAAQRDCRARAALQFMRVPWLARSDGRLVLGDLRFDREAALGFAEIDLDGAQPCPRAVPWAGRWLERP